MRYRDIIEHDILGIHKFGDLGFTFELLVQQEEHGQDMTRLKTRWIYSQRSSSD